MAIRHLDRFSWIFLSAALVLLGILGVVQFHWTSAIRDAERDKMESLMISGMERLAHDFNREISRIFLTYQRSFRQDPNNLAQALAQSELKLQEESPYPDLVEGVFLVELSTRSEETLLFKFLKKDANLEPTTWPAELGQIRERIDLLPRADGYRGLQEDPRSSYLPLVPTVPALLIPEGLSGRTHRHRSTRALTSVSGEGSYRFLIVLLDLSIIQNTVLPELAEHYFFADSHTDVDLAVLSNRPPHLVYSTAPERSLETRKSYDAEVPIFHLLYLEGVRSLLRHSRYHPTASPLGSGRRDGNRRSGPPSSRSTPKGSFPPKEIRFHDAEDSWRLVAQHRRGSLDRAVDAGHRLHLSIIFVVLLLMAGVLYQLLAATRKASRLASQQLEFITGITHELRTPLAGIRSLGQNLAHGVVQGSEQVKRYGALIEREENRLSKTIEQVLDFSGILSGQRILNLEPVKVDAVVSAALESVAPLAGEARVEIEQIPLEIDLWVSADGEALRRALENLLTNAIKYGGEESPVIVESRSSQTGRDKWVDISVRDHGPGIPREERVHLFKPFYRSPDVRDAQHPGSGLGLSLVQRILEAHGGKVILESTKGEGSTFTLRLPRAAGVDP